MEFLKERLSLRLYQQAILNTAASKNTLVVLPTGLGKTHVAVALAALRLPMGKILVLAPTKPLVAQHLKTFSDYFVPADKIALLSGEVDATKRAALWQNSQIIVSTPQTVRNDVLSGRINLKEVSLIVFDEAHRAVGDYAYVFLAKTYLQLAAVPKLMGLTASPGSDEEYIKQVCSNLFIEQIESRDRESPDVRPYVKKLVTEYKIVHLSEEILSIRTQLDKAIKMRLEILHSAGYVQSTDIKKVTKKNLLALQLSLQKQFAQQNFEVARAISVCAALMKLSHAHSLLESESLAALKLYFEDLWAASKIGKVRAVRDIVSDFNVRAAYSLVLSAIEKRLEHPKLAELAEVVKTQFEKNPQSKIIIFTEFRANIPKILEVFSNIPAVVAHKFIGQATAVDKGMSQATQIEILERFKKSEINCIVCTAVAEEGLDIPQVDLVIFYSPVPSAIRAIQRRGRTGRQAAGKLIILVAKGTKDEAYYWVAKHKERAMAEAIENFGEVEQPKLDSFDKPQQRGIVIFADSREQGTVVDSLYQQGVAVKIGRLKSGDFILSEEVGVERKRAGDFVNSLIDGRLFEQAKNLKANFVRPMYVVEGNLQELFSARNVRPQALWGALLSLIVDWKIPVLFSSNTEETAQMLVAAAKREQLENKKEISIREEHKPKDVNELQQFFIEGLPGIGPVAAKSLLKHFGSPAAIISADIKDLQAVEGIGPKKAELIKKILETRYNNIQNLETRELKGSGTEERDG